MTANVPTNLAPKSLEQLKELLDSDNKVKVAGCVLMCVHRPILADLATQASTVRSRLHFLIQRLIVSSGWGFARKVHGAFVEAHPCPLACMANVRVHVVKGQVLECCLF
jgi:hypothetical protein